MNKKLTYEWISKHYSPDDFEWNPKIQRWISKDKKLKLQSGDMYFAFDAKFDSEKTICENCKFNSNCKFKLKIKKQMPKTWKCKIGCNEWKKAEK